MLTRKQYELLMFIHERLKETGVPPSFDEMKDALDLRSKSGIHRLITALEERGFIRRLPNRARAMEVIRLPDSIAPGLGVPRPRGSFSPEVIEGSLGKPSAPAEPAPAPAVHDHHAGVEVPVMGRIAAGVPIEAIQTHSHSISVPADLLGKGEHYALEVRGDSMIEAGILDGDTVLTPLEVAQRVEEDLVGNLDYIVHAEAGSSSTLFPNSPYPRDCGPGDGGG